MPDSVRAAGTAGICTDLLSDPMNCGACGSVAPQDPASSTVEYLNICQFNTPQCANGHCTGAACKSGAGCSEGQSTAYSPGLGTVCPRTFTQCPSPNNFICCPNGFACSTSGSGCVEVNDEGQGDVEFASALAPAAQIFAFEGTSALSILSAMATFTPSNGPMNQISSSFQICADPAMQQVILEMAASGKSIFVSSGDNGGTQTAGAPLAGPPGGTPCPGVNAKTIDIREVSGVTVVGGTQLNMIPPDFPAAESYSFESAWDEQNFPSPFGSGGGICPDAVIPPYQASTVTALNPALNPSNLNPQVSTTNRMIPDVAMPAISLAYFVGGSGTAAGFAGTSGSSPLWAGYAALINQQLQQSQNDSAGFGYLGALGRIPQSRHLRYWINILYHATGVYHRAR